MIVAFPNSSNILCLLYCFTGNCTSWRTSDCWNIPGMEREVRSGVGTWTSQVSPCYAYPISFVSTFQNLRSNGMILVLELDWDLGGCYVLLYQRYRTMFPKYKIDVLIFRPENLNLVLFHWGHVWDYGMSHMAIIISFKRHFGLPGKVESWVDSHYWSMKIISNKKPICYWKKMPSW